MVRLLLIATLVLNIVACAPKTRQPSIVPGGAVSVSIPVPVCNSQLALLLEKRGRPHLPITDLSEVDENDLQTIQDALTDSINLLIEYVYMMEANQIEASKICSAINAAALEVNRTNVSIPKADK